MAANRSTGASPHRLNARLLTALAVATLAAFGFAGAAVATGSEEPGEITETETTPGTSNRTDSLEALAADGVPICGHQGKTGLVFNCSQFTRVSGRRYYQVPGS